MVPEQLTSYRECAGSMERNIDIAVVGSGIGGLSIAYHLSSETDAEIAVYERNDELAAETTAKSGAFIGHWGHESSSRLELMEYTMELYNQWLEDPKTDLSYHHVQRLHLSTSNEGAQELANELSEWREPRSKSGGSQGREFAHYIDGDDLKQLFLLPDLNLGEISGALYTPNLGYLTPQDLAQEFLLRTQSQGVQFKTGEDVELVVEDGQIVGISRDDQLVEAEEVIVACGPWTPKLMGKAGVNLPIRHSLAPVLKLSLPNKKLHPFPFIQHRESGYYMRQNSDGTIFLGHQPSGFDEAKQLDPSQVNGIPDQVRDGALEFAASLSPKLQEATIVEEELGVRSLTPDRAPIVGRTEVDGLSVAVFSANGIQLSPAAGKLLTQHFLYDESPAQYGYMSPHRFR